VAVERNVDQQCGALGGGTDDLQRSAECLDSIAQPDQSRSSVGIGSADAVVADHQPQDLPVGRELDHQPGCVRVTGRVGQRF
jgi:hypothetical protein